MGRASNKPSLIMLTATLLCAACTGGGELITTTSKCDGSICPSQAGQDSGQLTDATADDLGPADAAADDAARPDSAATDAARQDAAQPDSSPPDAATPDGATPDRALPDTAAPDTASPDAAAPDTAEPDSAAPDAARPDRATADAVELDAAAPDSAAPDAAGVDSADPCEDVFCGDHGSCELGVCVCDNGYMAHPDSGCTPYASVDFSLTDLNPNSSTYNQTRTLSTELGKVIVIYYVSYT